MPVKAKYTDKCLNFTISTEARLVFGVISQSRDPDWQAGLRESSDVSKAGTTALHIQKEMSYSNEVNDKIFYIWDIALEFPSVSKKCPPSFVRGQTSDAAL
jgi:hypothetical protein